MLIQKLLMSLCIVGVLLVSDLIPLRGKTFEPKGMRFAACAYVFGLTVFVLSSFCVRQGVLMPMLAAAAESIQKLMGG